MKNYSPYKNSELCNSSNWHKLLKMSREEVVNLNESWKENEKLNKQIYEENKTIRSNILKEVEEVLDKNNIIFRFKVPFGSRSKKKYQPFYEKFVEHICGLNSYIRYSFPYVQTSYGDGTIIDGVKIYNSETRNIIEFYDYALKTFEMSKKQEKVNENHFIECVKQAAQNNIDIVNLTKKEILDKVETFLKDKYMKDNYPQGKTVDIDDNHCECGCYCIGERRCDCGNRRISAYIEGNCLNGYYLTTEPY